MDNRTATDTAQRIPYYSASGNEVLAAFKRLHQQGRTIILVTHDRAVAEHADRIITLKDGVVTEEEVVDRPRDAEAELRSSEEKEGDG